MAFVLRSTSGSPTTQVPVRLLHPSSRLGSCEWRWPPSIFSGSQLGPHHLWPIRHGQAWGFSDLQQHHPYGGLPASLWSLQFFNASRLTPLPRVQDGVIGEDGGPVGFPVPGFCSWPLEGLSLSAPPVASLFHGSEAAAIAAGMYNPNCSFTPSSPPPGANLLSFTILFIYMTKYSVLNLYKWHCSALVLKFASPPPPLDKSWDLSCG